MSYNSGSEPTVSRTSSSRKRRPASHHTTHSSKRQSRRLFFESLEERRVLAVNFFAAPVIAPVTNHTDVLLGNQNNFEEPNLTINNRGDTGNILITSHNDSIASTNMFVTNSQGNYPVANRGDTWADIDSQGRAWWTNIDAGTGGIRVVEVNPTTGAPIGTGVVVNNPPGGQSDDRQALAVDSFPQSPWHDNIYVVWTRFGLGADGERVLVARSADHGVTWTTTDIGTNGGFDQQVHVAVNSNGDVYATYHLQPTFVGGQTSLPNGTSGQVIVYRSTDGGTTWTQTATNPFTAGQADITFNRQENGAVGNIPGTRFLTQGSVQPYVLPDPVRPDQVYVIAADDTDNNHGAGDDSDLYISRSDNNGATWTRTLLPIDGGTSFQLFPTAAIDQFGNIAVTWYDNRRGLTNAGGNFLLDWMGMYSVDGGISWSAPFRINDTAFNPDETPTTSFQGGPTTRIGEYYGLDLFGGTAYVVFNGNTAGNTTSQQPVFDAFSIRGSLVVTGDDNGPTNDNFLIRRLAGDANYVEITVNGVRQYVGLFESLSKVTFRGLSGNDSLVVDSTNGLLNIPNGIDYDGDGGFDSLTLSQTGGATQVSDTYDVGLIAGTGVSTIVGASGTQAVFFQGLEPLFDNVPATTATVNATPADNAINYVQGPGGGIFVGNTGRVTVDNQESFEFNNKTNLVINALAGSDTINLHYNNTANPAGLTGTISVNPADPTASDSLILNGIDGVLDNLRYLPTSVGAGTIVNDSEPQPNVLFTGTEHLQLVIRQTDGDGVRLDGTIGNDTVEFFHGATGGGSFEGTMDQNNATGVGPFSMTPMTYSGAFPLANDSDVNFFNPGGTDSFVYNGTTADDTIAIATGEAGGTEFRNTLNGILVSRVEVFNIASALVRGLLGNDTFNVTVPAGPAAVTLRVEGGDSDANTDTLNYTASSGATTTVSLATNTITQAGPAGNPVAYSGVERINIAKSGAGTTLVVVGTAGDDTIDFTPVAQGAGSFKADSTGAFVGTSPQFTYTGSPAITVDGGTGGFDETGIFATAGNDVINAIQQNSAQLQVFLNAFAQTFGIVSMEAARLEALSGDDLIRVSVDDSLVATPASSLRFTVDGGPPNASDRLIVNDDKIGDLTILRQAPDQRSGSVTVGVLNPVFYTEIERLDITPVNSVTGGTGTDGNGRIKVFHSDPFEYNETRLTAATLSRVGESANRPTIDPGAVVAPFAVPGDEDWYEFRPQATGTFAVKILFDLQPALANGRAGLPGNGDLQLDIYEADGDLITSGVITGGGKIATFGATNDPASSEFNRIFVRVRGTTPESLNHYEFDNLDGVGTGNPGVINVDVFGPQVTDVQVNNIPTATYNLFGQKPTNAVFHPTPLTTSLTISFRDPPPRVPGFLYPALDPASAVAPGTYVVTGDATGIAAISSIILVNNPVVVGGIPTATVQIVFAKPLADDRFTLTINDNLQDPAGNALDGESNAAEPNGAPTFPSGDTHAGSDFNARFTIDTRAELGSWVSGSVYVDTNGNYSFDPTNADASNRDITYLMGFTSDNLFAGNFVAAVAGVADGFDKLAAYGKVGTNYRWLIDTNNDSIPDINVVQPLFAGVTNIGGTPVAGNFDGNAANGDEVALKVGNTWLLDTNHDFKVDLKLAGSNMSGLPITGDFDGDGKEDLGAWADDKFSIDFGSNGLSGTTEFSFTFGFASVRERPVAADFDGDGITDLGLWVPDRAGVAPFESAEWYLFISNNQSILTRNAANGGMFFKPSPFGSDRFAQYGDEWGLPIAGNFDPPITSAQTAGSYTNSRDREDVDNDGYVSPIDALVIINRLNSGNTSLDSTPFARAPYVDVNGDGMLAPVDALLVINRLNAPSGGDSSGEGEAEDAFFSNLGSRPSSDSSLSALLAVDDYFSNRKK